MSVHVSHNSGNNEWYTPSWIIELARGVLGEIDLDPASSDIANSVVKAKTYYTKEQDGINKFWDGKVWMNPPYSSALIRDFCAKIRSNAELGYVTDFIVLTNNATETSWFRDLYSVADAFLFFNKRIRFVDPDGKTGKSPLQGQCLSYKGNNVKGFIDCFKDHGSILVKNKEV